MPEQNRAVQQAKQKGTSSWLNVLPLEDHGFTLTKGEFRDALAPRYSKPLRSLPSNCPCGQKFNVTHALNCKKGGFLTMRHSNIRDFEATLLRIVHNDVEVEPQLQQVETMNSLMDSKKIMLVLILEQKVYGETLKMHILIRGSRMLILTHRKICLLKIFFPSTSKIRKGL